MAVSADQLALGDLLEQHTPAMAIDQAAEFSPFRRAREVVPLHCGVMKAATAVDAWRILETSIPLDERPTPKALLTSPDDRAPPVVFGVVHLTAALAPRLPTSARRAMKL
jgi:hypothetical protein